MCGDGAECDSVSSAGSRKSSNASSSFSNCRSSGRVQRLRVEQRSDWADRDPLTVGKGSRPRQPGQQELPLSGKISCSTCRPALSQTCRKTTRDVAVRRAYRRCVRNVSACSADRQQQSGRFAGTLGKPSDGLEPSTPPPYHGGLERHARARAIARDATLPANRAV
jgi:hypothetical protein